MLINYQAMQYAERATNKHNVPWSLSAVGRIRPIAAGEHYLAKGKYDRPGQTLKNSGEKNQLDAVYSEVTGIGRNFNKCV